MIIFSLNLLSVSLLLADSAATVNYFVVVAVLAAKAKPFSEK